MRSWIFLSLCAAGYVLLIYWILRKLKDIAANPKKYDVIRGWDKYRYSFWYESSYKRYGRHYYASLIVDIPLLILTVALYQILGTMLQKFLFVPPDARFLPSPGLLIGTIACIFFFAGLMQFVEFYGTAPILVAARIYTAGFYEKQPKAWKKMFLWLLVLSMICLPVMALGINSYSYGDEEKIVTHYPLSVTQREIPYRSVLAGTTYYSCNDNCTEFSLYYKITLEDGAELRIHEFGIRGMEYLDTKLRENQIPVAYGEIDTATYERLKQNFDSKDMVLIDRLLTIVPSKE